MMQQTKKFRFGIIESLNAKFVEIPYKNLNYTMTIIMLNNLSKKLFDRTKFEELGRNLKTFDYESLKKFNLTQIQLKLPKFTVEQNIDPTSYLKNVFD